MKTITVRELHERTGEWVRQAAQYGEITITHRGRTVAKIIPQQAVAEAPYFSRRKLTPAFRKLMGSGRLRGGTDSTIAISEERDRSEQ